MEELPTLRSEEDGVLTITLNRPEKLNAMNRATIEALEQAVDDMRRRYDLRVLLITANGRYFSAGADLSESPKLESESESESESGSQARARLHQHSQYLWQKFEQLEKPIVVAHHATCVGGGLEMSLSCDFRLASENAMYSFPELKMGMVPASNGISRLTRICGPHWARWMAMANEPVDAQRALLMGLVHEIYPADGFGERVAAFCRKLAKQPLEAMAIAKIAIDITAELGMQEARQVERMCFSSLLLGEEHRDLKQQHLEKVLHARKP